jgi:hypothetical protein
MTTALVKLLEARTSHSLDSLHPMLDIHLHRHLTKIDYANLLYWTVYVVCKKGSPDPFETSNFITGYSKLEHTGIEQRYARGPTCTL